MPVLKGDANCDGAFDGKDPVFILNFVAARGNGFSTALGKIVDKALTKCRGDNSFSADDVAFLDNDGNTDVTTLDLVYMLDILAGNFYFMSVHVRTATEQNCSFAVTVVLGNEAGNPPAAGTQVLLDLTYIDADGKLESGLEKAPNLLSVDKGSEKTYLGV